MTASLSPQPAAPTRRRRWWWIVALLLLTPVALALHTWFARPLAIDWFFTRFVAQEALAYPEDLTRTHLLEPYGIRGHNGRLSDGSLAGAAKDYTRWRDALATLESYDRASLSPAQRESYDVLRTQLRDTIDAEPFELHYFRFNSTSGVQDQLPMLFTDAQPLRDATDAGLYIDRLEAFPERFAAERERLERAWQLGIRPQRFLVDRVLEGMRRFVAPPPREHVLYTHLASRLAKLDAGSIDTTERDALLARAATAVEKSVYPAYRHVAEWFANVQPKVIRNDGVWSQPNGATYYRLSIRHHTGYDLGAEAIHATGLRDVARLGARMDALLTELGYRDGKLGERVRALAASPGQIYPDSPAGRAAMLANYRELVTRAMPVLRKHFRSLPHSRLDIRAVPDYAAATSPGGYYYAPSFGDATPGIFYVNLIDVRALPRFTMATLTHHEAVPGHHFQIALAVENTELPLFRRMPAFTAYDEGWALYAEQLAAEVGLIRSREDELGRLQSEMFRAVRLVVDTGMHAKRWSRESAIAYMIEHTGMTDAEVTAEIERYLVDPGQALAYKIGMNKLLELRARARTALGPRFLLADFHDVVLGSGSVPLTIVEANVDAYIAGARSAAPAAENTNSAAP